MTGIGVAYPKPFPIPPSAPNTTKIQPSDEVKELRKNPTLTSTPPVTETQNGPFLSWSRPAALHESANTTPALVQIVEVSARFQPNAFRRVATTTLQAETGPRPRFRDSPRQTPR